MKVTTISDLRKEGKKRMKEKEIDISSFEYNLYDFADSYDGVNLIDEHNNLGFYYLFNFNKMSEDGRKLFDRMLNAVDINKIKYCIQQSDFMLYTKILSAYPNNEVYLTDFKLSTMEDCHDVIYDDILLYSWMDKEGKIVAIKLLC